MCGLVEESPVWTWSVSHAARSRQHMCTCQYDVCLFVGIIGDKVTPWVSRLNMGCIFTRGSILTRGSRLTEGVC